MDKTRESYPMNHTPNDPGDNPYRPKTSNVRDLGHDAQLLRDLAIINAETVARLGPLPPGGLPVQPKRKPNLPHAAPPITPMATRQQEDDPMKLHQMVAAALLPLALATGCSQPDSAHPAKNPHPVKRYEVIATSDAPGPWDSIRGSIGYDLEKADDGIVKCMPVAPFFGVQSLTSIDIDIELTRVDAHTWRGYFYRDALQDADYSGLGVCHWDVTSVGVITTAQGVSFGWSIGLEPHQHEGSETTYFKKSVYGDRSFAQYGAPDLTAEDPEVIQHPDAYFRASVAVKEITP